MTDPSLFDRAGALIASAAEHPDPEAAMEALEREADPADRVMFDGLWEALARRLAETETGVTPR